MLGINLEAIGVPVVTIAITGPGADRLPWDDDYCRARGRTGARHSHSGPKGCRVQQRALREWCDTLTYRWQLYRQAARIATKREVGYAPPWIVARVWEPQKRGVPHLHLVLPFGSPQEKLAAWAFLKHLKRLAKDYDFGRVGREKNKPGPELQPISGQDAARYLANYLAGRTGKKTSIRENIADEKLPRSLLWLTPKLTRQTLVTMRTLRRARHLWAAAGGLCPVPRWTGLEEAVRVVSVFRTVYPKRAGPTANRDVALAFARDVDQTQDRRGGYLRNVWDYARHEYVPNDELFTHLTHLAFVATRGAEAVAA